MNFLRKRVKDPAIRVKIGEDAADLSALLHPSCAAAIWRRQTPPAVQAWLDGLDPAVLPRGRVVLRPGAVAEAVGHLCDIAAMPRGPERDWFQQDVTGLAAQFAGLPSAPFLRLRLDVVTTDACRKFHMDAIRARLLCTYRGTGTQYGLSVTGQDPDRVFTVQTGAPIVMRGSLWPPQPASGFLHRSPPIEGTGQTRLVLVLDPVLDPEDAA